MPQAGAVEVAIQAQQIGVKFGDGTDALFGYDFLSARAFQPPCVK